MRIYVAVAVMFESIKKPMSNEILMTSLTHSMDYFLLKTFSLPKHTHTIAYDEFFLLM